MTCPPGAGGVALTFFFRKKVSKNPVAAPAAVKVSEMA